MLIKEKVFLLKKTRYGEADLILQALTPNGARVSLFARSALKSRKRFGGGVLEPLHYVLALFDDKRAHDAGGLCSLREANLIEDFKGLRADYARLELALGFVQLASDVSREGDVGSGELFNLLGNALRAAETSQSLERLRIHFVAKLLAIQGMLRHEREESMLRQAPISEHASVRLDSRAPGEIRDVAGDGASGEDGAWRATGARLDRSLREYLNRSA